MSAAEPVAFKYRAFLSYSHRDTASAKWLHARLEGHRIDKDLIGRATPAGPVPKTLRPVFRDREDFSAGHSLTEQTLAALEASRFLVVLCSPEAARSEYVNEEIRRFKALGRADRVIPVIIAGEPGDPEHECFPPALRFKLAPDGSLTDVREEPIAADARPQGDGREAAARKVVAGLLGVGLDEIVRRAERARKRRNRFWAALAGLFLLLAVAATGGLVWARYELARNEALLDRTLQRATGLVDRAVAMSEQFGVPRGVSLGVLQDAESLFRDMADLGRETPQLRYRKAVMLIAFARNYAVLGQSEMQRTRAAEAHRLMQGLAAEDPGNRDWQRDLALTHDGLGDVLVTQGAFAEALENYRATLIILRRLVEDEPSNGHRQRDLTVVYEKIGGVLLAHGAVEQALALFRESLRIREQLAAVNPDNALWQRDLSVSHEKIGDILLAQAKPDDALASYRASLAAAESLTARDPANAQFQRDLSVVQEKLADVLADQGAKDEALKYYQSSLAIRMRLAAADPANAGWQRDLAIAYSKIGDVSALRGERDEALRNYQANFAIIEKLARGDPKNAGLQRDLMVSHNRIGDMRWAKGERAEALSSYRAALVIGERLVAADPANVQFVWDLMTTHARLASRGDEPARRFTLIVAALKALQAENKLNPDQVKWLSEVELRLAKLQDPQAPK